MDILNILMSSILGFVSGLASSYFFWLKQRQLDRPRLELFFYNTDNKKGYHIKNKGGSFAEHPHYSYGHYHDIGEPDDTKDIYLDSALAPGEEQKIWPELLPPQDANIEVFYADVFGKKYNDSWDIHYVREFDFEEWDYVLFKRYFPKDNNSLFSRVYNWFIRLKASNFFKRF